MARLPQPLGGGGGGGGGAYNAIYFTCEQFVA